MDTLNMYFEILFEFQTEVPIKDWFHAHLQCDTLGDLSLQRFSYIDHIYNQNWLHVHLQYDTSGDISV